MNLGLSKDLKIEFPDIVPIKRPLVTINPKIETDCIVGFAEGEGCFFIKLAKNIINSKYQITSGFQITQYNRDVELITNLTTIFGCGRVERHYAGPALNFIVTKLTDLNQKIIPFFEKNSLKGSKFKNFLDFCKVVELINNKSHLTENGLEEILKIKSGMNSLRKNI